MYRQVLLSILFVSQSAPLRTRTTSVRFEAVSLYYRSPSIPAT